MATEPLLPAMAVGSYATPGWLFLFREQMRAGAVGGHDIEEAFDDATRLAVQDQIEAGVDVVCDGELRRMRFVYEMYDRLTGLERIAPQRRLGVPGYDRAPHFVARGHVAAPEGLGVLQEYEKLRALCPGRPLKIALPGPLTFAMNIEGAKLDDLVAIVAAEVHALAAAGASLIQLDEPGLASPPPGGWPDGGVAPINAALTPTGGRGAVHVCFGNNASRPMAKRALAPLLPAMRRLDCDLLLLEFANREMAEIEILAELHDRFRIGVGVVDVKSFHIETAEDVAGRLRLALRYCPAARLVVTMDCGLSALPRWLAREKLQAMVAGASLARA